MHRVEVHLKSHLPDARGLGLVKDIRDLGITTVTNVHVVDIYWLDDDLTPDELGLVCYRLLADAVTQDYFYGRSSQAETRTGPAYHTVEVAYNAGVADPVEESVLKAIRDLGLEGVREVKTSKKYIIEGQLDENQLEVICGRLLVNPIIQHVVEQEHFTLPGNPQYKFQLEQVDILSADKAELASRFGFNDDELQAIIRYFQQQERNPTDVEFETLAQTWSEHCVHKTFKARIKLGSKTINNLLKSTIMKATVELNKRWSLTVERQQG